jgi:hypothetical protein
MEITSARRDAQGLTFSLVIPTRAMQPKSEERGNQKWRMALCGYGMAFALRHRVHLVVQQPFESLAPPRCAPARVIPGRTLLEGEGRVGSRASPQVQSTPSGGWWGLFGVPVPVPPKTQSVQCLCGATPLLLSLQSPRFDALGAWICGPLHPQGNLSPARAFPRGQSAD